MPLVHVLYRCPACGHDPMEDAGGDRAACPGCGVRLLRARRGVELRPAPATGRPEGREARSGEGPPERSPALPALGAGVHPVAELVDRIRAWGGPLTAARMPDGAVRYGSRAFFRGFVDEEPVHRGGRLLGFVEAPRRKVEGRLVVTGETLSFEPDAPLDPSSAPPAASAGAGGGSTELRWSLLELTALQVSTRSLQVGVARRGTFQVTLARASTFRWEELLQHLLRRAWKEEGWGPIVEFQPRITGPEGWTHARPAPGGKDGEGRDETEQGGR